MAIILLVGFLVDVAFAKITLTYNNYLPPVHIASKLSESWCKEIEKRTKVEVRYVALRHLQRGGAPTAYDRRMGRKFGIAAVDMIVGEDFGRMASLKHGEITTVPLKKALEKLSLVDVEKYYNTKNYRALDQVL